MFVLPPEVGPAQFIIALCKVRVISGIAQAVLAATNNVGIAAHFDILF